MAKESPDSKLETLRSKLESVFVNANKTASNDEEYESPTKRENEPISDELSQADSGDAIKLPSPPSSSPETDKKNDFEDCKPFSTDRDDSYSSSLSGQNSFTWHSASSDLPSLLSLNEEDEERLIWPLEEEFSIHNGRFQEDEDYILSIEVGGGASGKCYLAATTSKNPADEERVFCVKKCKYIKTELLALHLARKENIMEIITFYGAKLNGREASIFMEFMAGGSIADFCAENKGKSWPVIEEITSLGIIEDVLKAVDFLHSKGIVHRDIKGANVLLAESTPSFKHFFHAKLADFGSAESYTEASPSDDIWKTGCLLLEMLNGMRSPLVGISERSNRHLFSRHDNRHAPNDMGDLETYFGMGMGKRKYLQPGQTQHTRSTQDIITWRGNECPNPPTTYRSDFPSGSRTSSRGYNESELIHVRSNLELRRRHLRAASPLRRSVEQLRYLLGMSQMTRYMESLELVSDSRFGNKDQATLPRPLLHIQPRLPFAYRLHPVHRVLLSQKQSFLLVPRDYEY